MHLRHITSSRRTRVSWWVSRPEGGQLIKGRPCHLSSWWSTKVWKKASNSQNHIEIRVPQKIYNKQIKIDKHQVHLFDSDPNNRTIILLYTTYLLIHVLLTSKVCFGHIVGASAFPQQPSVIGGSYFSLRAGPQVMVVIWTSFIDSSLHTSRNYVQ